MALLNEAGRTAKPLLVDEKRELLYTVSNIISVLHNIYIYILGIIIMIIHYRNLFSGRTEGFEARYGDTFPTRSFDFSPAQSWKRLIVG